jgi:hypothetical protein
MKKFIKFHILWDWYDFGIVFKVYKNIVSADYWVSIDIQVMWFNLWIQCFRRKTPPHYRGLDPDFTEALDELFEEAPKEPLVDRRF